MALLAAKLHHEYYWLPLAPVAAVGVARALDGCSAERGACAARCCGSVLVVLCAFQTAPPGGRLPSGATSRRPPSRVGRSCRGETLVAASEALLFQADRRGCRMEWTSDAARRAAGEWAGLHRRSKARSI